MTFSRYFRLKRPHKVILRYLLALVIIFVVMLAMQLIGFIRPIEIILFTLILGLIILVPLLILFPYLNIRSVVKNENKTSLNTESKNTIDQSIQAAEQSIEKHSSRANLYMGVIGVTIFGFIYFVFFSLTHDFSTVNKYLKKASALNAFYYDYMDDYQSLIYKITVLEGNIDFDYSGFRPFEYGDFEASRLLGSKGKQRDSTIAVFRNSIQNFSHEQTRILFGSGMYDTLYEYSYISDENELTQAGAEYIMDKYITLRDSLFTLANLEDRYSVSYQSTPVEELEIDPFSGSTILASANLFIYLVFMVFVILLSVFIALYRNQLKEVTRLEQLKFAFMRIRIAGNNFDSEGFKTDVREALTKGAFDFTKDEGFLAKKSKKAVESPLPGYPTSDAAALLLSKLIDNLDVMIKPKSDKSNN